MDLLGLSLSEIQSYMPEERFTLGTTLRIGLQIIDVSLLKYNMKLSKLI